MAISYQINSMHTLNVIVSAMCIQVYIYLVNQLAKKEMTSK